MGLSLRKSLGQHFLRDENISRKIVDALKERKFLQLLEVGPGAGALTKYLQTLNGIEFRAVELDKEKIVHILEKMPAMKGRIIHDDFLQMEKPFNGPFSIVGNFPYNISTQILFRIIDWRMEVEQMIGMFQKEVALRVASREGNKTYGVLSVLVQAFFNVEYLFEVPPSAFMPPPKVQSAVIRLLPKTSVLHYRSEKDFFILVKMAFNQRRKTLRNAVRPLFAPAVLEDPVFNKRAEQLSVEGFAQLTHQMNRINDNK
jgi:16S rRNA (adenine1518-N6/adenine1519-N6)-dimethyltransferase